MARPVHFEIHATDVERARSFYTAVFGWSIEKDGNRWVIRTGNGEPGIDGTLLARQGPHPDPAAPVNGFLVRMLVTSIDETTLAVENNGGEITVPTIPVPDIGLLAVGRDPDGNLFQMVQPDPFPT
ncbi:VOC family protein [Streptomyces lydicus]|uniref:VOC family protein n=1 Tax=Streptomyces lydicus TaxID=47763 RepID=UPI00332F3716